MTEKKNLNRRKFIAQTSAAGVGVGVGLRLSIIPSYVLERRGRTSANDKILFLVYKVFSRQARVNG